LVKEVQTASLKKAYKNDINIINVKQDINKWTKFVEKLRKFISGKPSYMVAAAGAILYAFLSTEVAKSTWINGLADTSDAASINQFGGFLMLIATFSMIPGVYHIIKNLCKNAGYDSFEELKKDMKKNA
jgi:hypothetical protein